MKNPAIFLTVALLLTGCASASNVYETSPGVFTVTGIGADYKKGYAAYESGDFATALREWTSLAEQGDSNSQTFLGRMYDEGKGVPQDYKTAVKWYSLAAEQGSAGAQSNLGPVPL
jgi:hypothetical protein